MDLFFLSAVLLIDSGSTQQIIPHPLRYALEEPSQIIYPHSEAADQEFALNGTKVDLLNVINGRQECHALMELGSQLLYDETYCDIELRVVESHLNDSQLDQNRHVFCAHRNVLSLRSSYLKQQIVLALLRTVSAGEKPFITLQLPSPDSCTCIFEYILQYMYTNKIDPSFDIKRDIMHLYVAAEYLDLQLLVTMIEDYLRSNLATTHDLFNYVGWAHKYKYNKIKNILLEIIVKRFGMSLPDYRQFIKLMCRILGLDGGKSQDGKLDPLVLLNEEPSELIQRNSIKQFDIQRQLLLPPIPQVFYDYDDEDPSKLPKHTRFNPVRLPQF